MASGAKFSINGSPTSAGGVDLGIGTIFTLELEAYPALDVTSCVYSIVGTSPGAPTITLLNGGVADPPTAQVTGTTPEETGHTYFVQCQTNGGAAVKVNGRDDYSINTVVRAIAIRTVNGLRKIVVGERVEYDPTYGWTAAFDELVDALDTLWPTGPSSIMGISVTAPLTKSGPTNNPMLAVSNATDSTDGAMSAADKTKLDGIEAGAQVTSFARVATALGAATTGVSFNSQKITALADPTAGSQEAATAHYADAGDAATLAAAQAYTDTHTSASSVYIAASIAAARALPSAPYITGTEVHVSTTYTVGPYDLPQITVYAWDSGLTLPDDGAIVLQPDDVSGAGRLIRTVIYRTGEISSGGGQGLSVYAGDTPPGAPSSGELNLRAASIVRLMAGGNTGLSYDGTSLSLSDIGGITGPSTGFSFTQRTPDPGTNPSEAGFQGMNAATGDAADGGGFSWSGGLPGGPGNKYGGFTFDLVGADSSGNTNSFAINLGTLPFASPLFEVKVELGSTKANLKGALSVTEQIALAPMTAPSAPASGFLIYCDVADGKLKALGTGGTPTTLANP